MLSFRQGHDFRFFVLSRAAHASDPLLDPISGPLGAVLGPVLTLLGLPWALFGGPDLARRGPPRGLKGLLGAVLGHGRDFEALSGAFSSPLGPLSGIFRASVAALSVLLGVLRLSTC